MTSPGFKSLLLWGWSTIKPTPHDHVVVFSERNQTLAANNNLLLHQRKLKVFEKIFFYYALMKPTVLLSLGCTIFHLNKCGVTTWQIVFLDLIDLIPHLNDLLCFLLWPKYGWRCLLAVRVTEELTAYGGYVATNTNTTTIQRLCTQTYFFRTLLTQFSCLLHD